MNGILKRKKKRSVRSMFKKIQYRYLLKKYVKWGVWRVAVCPSNIGRTDSKG
jgi:hypothetical protein